jgi:hypothetical protein
MAAIRFDGNRIKPHTSNLGAHVSKRPATLTAPDGRASEASIRAQLALNNAPREGKILSIFAGADAGIGLAEAGSSMNKSHNRWDNLYDRLVRRAGFEILKPPKEVINSALERVEKLFHCPLPPSYKEFVSLFGPGEIGGYFRILGPAIEGFRNWGSSLEGENQDLPEYMRSLGRADLATRLIGFSDTIGGDACFWDREDVRDPIESEYGIYVYPREAVAGKVVLVANSFGSFIEEVCLGNGFDRIGGGWGEEKTPPQTFRPAWPTRKLSDEKTTQ